MQMTIDSSQLIHPIDGHAPSAQGTACRGGRVEEAVNVLEMSGSFKPFQRAFYR